MAYPEGNSCGKSDCAYHTDPAREYAETSHSDDPKHSLPGIRKGLFHREVANAINYVVSGLHEEAPLQPGEQWTIPFHYPCGLIGSVVLRIDDLGTCGPVMSDEATMRAAKKALADMEREDRLAAMSPQDRQKHEMIAGLRIEVQGGDRTN